MTRDGKGNSADLEDGGTVQTVIAILSFAVNPEELGRFVSLLVAYS